MLEAQIKSKAKTSALIPVNRIRVPKEMLMEGRRCKNAEYDELKESILTSGMSEPLLLKDISGKAEQGITKVPVYVLVSGARRLQVMKDLGKSEVMAVVQLEHQYTESPDANFLGLEERRIQDYIFGPSPDALTLAEFIHATLLKHHYEHAKLVALRDLHEQLDITSDQRFKFTVVGSPLLNYLTERNQYLKDFIGRHGKDAYVEFCTNFDKSYDQDAAKSDLRKAVTDETSVLGIVVNGFFNRIGRSAKSFLKNNLRHLAQSEEVKTAIKEGKTSQRGVERDKSPVSAIVMAILKTTRKVAKGFGDQLSEWQNRKLLQAENLILEVLKKEPQVA